MSRWTPMLVSVFACAVPQGGSRYPTGTAALLLTPQQQIATAAGKELDIDTVQICEYERITGSQIPEWRCRYLEQRERETFAAQKYLLQAQSMGGARPNEGRRTLGN